MGRRPRAAAARRSRESRHTENPWAAAAPPEAGAPTRGSCQEHAGSLRKAATPQQRRPDITRARDLLGWEPTVELAEGLRRTIDQAGVESLVGAGD